MSASKPALSKDTVLCLSLARRPGNHGTRFHNALYAEFGLDFVYLARTTDDLPAAIAGLRALGVRGCSVSMPFKEDAIGLVDELDPSAAAIDSINTIVNDGGRLRAYNTDYLAVVSLLTAARLAPDTTVAVLGSGGMAKAVVAAVRDAGLADGVVVARNRETGSTLAERYGWRHVTDVGALPAPPHLLVNATPVGMAGGPAADELPVPTSVVDAARLVFDVVASPARTPLIRRAAEQGIET
ncbi:MAG: shikimate dehydrogenase, partial [Frankiaceae bacterium]|nr:shikimate dehydrogenase [Frankiaceae bacterium]